MLMLSDTELNIEGLAQSLHVDGVLCADELLLSLGECLLRVRSNSSKLLMLLRAYFSHVELSAENANQHGQNKNPDIEVVAIERDAPDLALHFTDWNREPGKPGRKDSYFDFEGGRLIRKVRTGMVFLQSKDLRIAAGPCLQYDNQVINFINAQYMNWLQHRGWLICHAAGLTYRGMGFGIAGFSGGGKSTLMLHLLENDDVSYMSNDRLFVRKGQIDGQGTVIEAVGIPKLPRVNPGTIVHNPRLQSLIPANQRESLLAMPSNELWELEEKYDVMIEQVYSPNKILFFAPLKAFLVLNWQRDSDERLRLEQVNLAERLDLLGAIMKSPGPFYQLDDESFYQDMTDFDEQVYLSVFENITVYEAKGGIDFDALLDLYFAVMKQSERLS
jgi:HprK-related kinase B